MPSQDLVPVHELATAAYCPRKLYYERRDGDPEPPPEVERVRELAFEYLDLLDASDAALSERPIAVEPEVFRRRLRRTRERFSDAWSALAAPDEREVLLTGRDCRGYAAKILGLDSPAPAHVSAGRPPERGVWESDGVRAVALAKALAYREQRPVERAFVEYPRTGVVRRVTLTTRRKAAYRRTLRTVRQLDGPPPRIGDDAKCGACEYRGTCGVRTRSLRSLLGG